MGTAKEELDDGWPRGDEEGMPDWLLGLAKDFEHNVPYVVVDDAESQQWVEAMKAKIREVTAEVRRRRR